MDTLYLLNNIATDINSSDIIR